MKDEEKKLDEFLQRIIQEHGPASAPKDFTLNVMGKIDAEKSPVFEYQPLIKKWVWGLIAAIAVVVTGVAAFSSGPSPQFGHYVGKIIVPIVYLTDLLTSIEMPSMLIWGMAAMVLFAMLDQVVNRLRSENANP